MFKPKIWLRLGALAVASSATALPKPILATQTQEDSKEAARQPGTAGPVLAQSGRRGAGGEGGEGGGEGGEAGTRRPAVTPKLTPQQQQKSKAKQRGGFGVEGGQDGERGSGRRSDRAPT